MVRKLDVRRAVCVPMTEHCSSLPSLAGHPMNAEGMITRRYQGFIRQCSGGCCALVRHLMSQGHSMNLTEWNADQTRSAGRASNLPDQGMCPCVWKASSRRMHQLLDGAFSAASCVVHSAFILGTLHRRSQRLHVVSPEAGSVSLRTSAGYGGAASKLPSALFQSCYNTSNLSVYVVSRLPAHLRPHNCYVAQQRAKSCIAPSAAARAHRHGTYWIRFRLNAFDSTLS